MKITWAGILKKVYINQIAATVYKLVTPRHCLNQSKLYKYNGQIMRAIGYAASLTTWKRQNRLGDDCVE